MYKGVCPERTIYCGCGVLVRVRMYFRYQCAAGHLHSKWRVVDTEDGSARTLHVEPGHLPAGEWEE